MPSSAQLKPFLEAQQTVYADVKAELTAGRKQSHWMWFVFPQLSGLGQSHMARKYALPSVLAARQYYDNKILGPRLCECTDLVLSAGTRAIEEIFPEPDHLKFHSCMTLFRLAIPEESLFREALRRFHGGEMDHQTLVLLGRPATGPGLRR